MKESIGRPVVVTTEYRGVFFGYTTDDPTSEILTLTRCRMCVYWSKAVRGVLGLAVGGPKSDCRVTAPVESAVLREITAVLSCTPEAAAAWERGPWSE